MFTPCKQAKGGFMARIRLTIERIRGLECEPGKGQSFMWDSEIPGLGVRITSGAKGFIFQSRLGGKTIRLKIGDVRTWNIDAARQEARSLQTLIDQGIDPRLDKKQKIEIQEAKRAEDARHSLTLGDVFLLYIDARKAKWSERYLADHFSLSQKGGVDVKFRGKRGAVTKPGPLSPLMNLKLNELTPDRVKAWAKKEAATRPTRTRIAFAILKAFINWCHEQPEYKGAIPTDAVSSRIKKDVLPKQKPKTDCLQREQLPAWFKAVREIPNRVLSAYLQAMLLTGARREEIMSLLWDDIDFQWNGLTIRDKVEGLRTIPLTPYVKMILDQLPRRNQFVFSSPTSENGRLQEPRYVHNKALSVAGIEHLTIHGLRRSFGTLSEWIEVPAGVVAQIMGHKPSATAEKHYRPRPLDLLRMWHEKIEKWILEQAGIEQPGYETKGLRAVK
jgi:integrase